MFNMQKNLHQITQYFLATQIVIDIGAKGGNHVLIAAEKNPLPDTL